MRSIMSALAIAASLAAFSTTPVRAQSCGDLWVAINSLYQSYGYCFRTRRAIEYFGNAGCRTSNMGAVRASMSRADRGKIDRLVQMSREQGCRD